MTFTLQDEEIEMLEDLKHDQRRLRGRINASQLIGELIRKQHKEIYPTAWKGSYYKDSLK